jgi:peptide/nickel transport system permease protein
MTGIALVLRRIGWALVVAWFAVTVTFALIALIPADPAQALLGPHATPDAVAHVRAHYCLDRGLVAEYGCYVGHVAHGDLGKSYRSKRAVTAILADHLWPTAQLALAAIVLQLVIAVPLGVLAAARRGRSVDHAASLVVWIGQSAPAFFVGTLLLYIVSYRFDWFPLGGYGDGVVDRLRHLVLPATTLAALGVAYYARAVRSEMLDVLGEDYIRTARAKGVPERLVLARHALRNALGPLVTLVGLDLGLLLGGTVVTEEIFSWPGIGREVLHAILEVDIPLIVGVVLASALAIALANLAVDLVLLRLDPRLRDGP